MTLVTPTTGTIFRERIVRRLEEAARHPVTVILAPAGCGKSVALGQYLATVHEPWFRYDLRPENGTLLGFVRGFAGVLLKIAPGAHFSAADAVSNALASEAPAKALALWMSNHLPYSSAVVAIDGFHHAESAPACSEFIAALVERTNAYVRWIFASRSAQRLPISSWLVYGDASVPITETELRFTADEAHAAARSSRSTLTAADVERLLETTEGWATAFTLALRMSEHSLDAQSATTAARQLSYDYLAEHVYRSLSSEERSLLAVAALLPEIDVAVLERAGFDRAGVMLESLQRATFLTRDATPAAASQRYRCSDLFRDFLKHELEMQGEDAGNAVRLQAANALPACERYGPALRLYASARATEETLAFLAGHGFEIGAQAHGDIVQTAIDSLPETLRSNHPLVLGLRAQLEHTQGRYDRAQALYERALAATRDPLLTATLVARLCGTLLNQGKDPKHLLEPLAHDESLPIEQRGELLALLAVAYARFETNDGIVELFERVEAVTHEIASDMTRAQMLHQLGTAAVLYGDSSRADAALERAAELAAANGLFRLASLAYTSLGSNAMMNDDDLPKALAAAQNAADAAVKAGELYIARFAIVRQFYVAVHRGDDERIEALLQEYDALPTREESQLRKAKLWVCAMQAAWKGDFTEACRLQSEAGTDQPYPEERLLSIASHAVFSIAAGRREEALSYVRAALEESRTAASRRPAFARTKEIVRILCALVEAFAGRSTAAQRLLQKRLRVNEPIPLLFHETVSAIVANLETGLAASEAAPYLAELRARWYGGYARLFEALVRRYEAAREADVVLTPTELSVFRSLSAGRTPKEIAVESGSSIHTVRWHIRQGIAKFGCSGREQALRAARARGFL
ncbi:MAG: hypothetical protein JO199_14010 [Candidatus Eremiobacteraeota bacterium]|nr:hypothetical protein [Candidatus Eremiobacteraeota bacterium]